MKNILFSDVVVVDVTDVVVVDVADVVVVILVVVVVVAVVRVLVVFVVVIVVDVGALAMLVVEAEDVGGEVLVPLLMQTGVWPSLPLPLKLLLN